MLVATAGHIDHGKTALVRALTGVDTDRLPEEKARGISIDIGFAYWRPASAPPRAGSTAPRTPTIGFVDVPGHERFVRNMLAGVWTIDYAIVVVAADDGVMPQTVEHVQILDLLAIRRGVAIITKIDRASPERIGAVEREVRRLLEPTSLARAHLLRCSPVTGEGIDALRRTLVEAAGEVEQRGPASASLRYVIDRAFSVQGSGTVVTGTVVAGTVGAGDRVILSPSGRPVRVRGAQAQGRAVERVAAGERCALNLAGVEVGEVTRGDWVLDAELHGPTRLLEVRLHVSRDAERALRHWMPVHLHLGTVDVMARIAMPAAASIEAGTSASARLVVERAIVAAHGDRFIVRDPSALRTLGGGEVIDAHPPRRRRQDALRPLQLAALEAPSADAALGRLTACSPAGIDTSAFRRNFALSTDAMQALLRKSGWLGIGKESSVALPQAVGERVAALIDAALKRLHAASDRQGIDIDELRRLCAPGWSARVFSAFLRGIARDARLELKGSVVRSLAHAPQESTTDVEHWQRVQLPLEAAGPGGTSPLPLARATGIKEPILRDFLHRKTKTAALFFLGDDVFVGRGALARFAAFAQGVAEQRPQGRFSAAEVRDAAGLSRARTVQLLECLDRLGVTLRIGNLRTIRRAPAEVFGDARERRGGARCDDVPC